VLRHQSKDCDILEKAIQEDLTNDFVPCMVVSTQGTTGTLAFDDVARVGIICEKYDCWHHVDAAWAGNAYLLPEFHHYTRGFDKVDSYVFNPHKWLFTNFDASAYFVRSKERLLSTFEILPEYLKTRTRGKVNDYRDWGIPLGRRFRALKLWFVIRTYGVNGLQKKIREHIELAKWLEEKVKYYPKLELMTETKMNLVACRYTKPHADTDTLNTLNEKIIEHINSSGKAFLTHTKIEGQYVIRINVGGSLIKSHHLGGFWDFFSETIEIIEKKYL
jgi:aromatic-L-amino-acid decarboxylase